MSLRIFGQSAEFVGWLVLARRLGPAPFGILAIAFAMSRYLGLVADWGAPTLGTRDLAELAESSPEQARLAGSALVAWRRGLGATLAAVFAVGALASGNASVAPAALVILARGVSVDWMALGRHQPLRAATPVVVQGLSLIVVAPIVSTTSGAALAVGGAYALGAASSLVLNRPPRSRMSWTGIPAAWLLVAALAGQLMLELDIVMLGSLRGARAAGIYAAVYRIPNAASTLVGLALLSALPGVTVALSRDPHGVRKLTRASLRLSRPIGLITAAIGAPAAIVLVRLSLGAAYQPGTTAAAILMLGVAVAVAAAPLHPIYLAAGTDRRYAEVLGAAAGTNLILNLLLIPAYGLTGAAVATLASQVQLCLHLDLSVRQLSSRP